MDIYGNKPLNSSSVNSYELDCLKYIKSNIQQQLDNKLSTNLSYGKVVLDINGNCGIVTADGFSSLTQTALGNCGIGTDCLKSLTTGDYNIAIGNLSGRDLTTGSNNIIIGSQGGDALSTQSNNVIIGNSSIQSYLFKGSVSSTAEIQSSFKAKSLETTGAIVCGSSVTATGTISSSNTISTTTNLSAKNINLATTTTGDFITATKSGVTKFFVNNDGGIGNYSDITSTGKITGGNIETGGSVTATGNISSNAIIGSDSLLTNSISHNNQTSTSTLPDRCKRITCNVNTVTTLQDRVMSCQGPACYLVTLENLGFEEGSAVTPIMFPIWNSVTDLGNATRQAVISGSIYQNALLPSTSSSFINLIYEDESYGIPVGFFAGYSIWNRADRLILMPGYSVVVYSQSNFTGNVILACSNTTRYPLYLRPTESNSAKSIYLYATPMKTPVNGLWAP